MIEMVTLWTQEELTWRCGEKKEFLTPRTRRLRVSQSNDFLRKALSQQHAVCRCEAL
jgi:hypothetical protein